MEKKCKIMPQEQVNECFNRLLASVDSLEVELAMLRLNFHYQLAGGDMGVGVTMDLSDVVHIHTLLTDTWDNLHGLVDYLDQKCVRRAGEEVDYE